jgi:hypothetical protein
MPETVDIGVADLLLDHQNARLREEPSSQQALGRSKLSQPFVPDRL